MVRNAKFADIHAILRFLQAEHARTHYAKTVVQIDADETKRLLVASINRHGHQHGGACWVQVIDHGDNIDGLMLATLARVYSIFDKLMATDLLWITNEYAKPAEAMLLMRNMIEWAHSCPLVVEVHIAASAIINDKPDLVTRLLRPLGLKHYGNVHRLEFGERLCPASSAA